MLKQKSANPPSAMNAGNAVTEYVGRGSLRRRRDKLRLILLLVGTYLLSAAWAVATPVPAGRDYLSWGNFHPDEGSHAAVIRYMAIHKALPRYERPYDTSIHPPLYHGLAAIAYGVTVQAFGDAYTLLIVRLLTVCCGVGTVYLTYRTGRTMTTRSTALFAATLVALLPMRASIGGAITNENLAAFGAAGALCLLSMGWADRRRGFTARDRLMTLAGFVILGVGSKVTCLILIPMVFASIVCEAQFRRRPIRPSLIYAFIVAVSPVVAWGWWFNRNRVLYGDFLRKAAADRLWDASQPGFAVLHLRNGTSPVYYAKILTTRSWLSFWGMFDGFTMMLPFGVYAAAGLLQFAAIAGLIHLVRSGWLTRRLHRAAFLITVILFAVGVAAVFYQYNWSHYTPQGRYYFVLLVPFGLLTALGLRSVCSPLFAHVRTAASVALIVCLIALNLWCLWKSPRHHIAILRATSTLKSKQDTAIADANATYYGSQPLSRQLCRAS